MADFDGGEKKQGNNWFFRLFIAFDVIAIVVIGIIVVGLIKPPKEEVEPPIELTFEQTTVVSDDATAQRFVDYIVREKQRANQERFEHSVFLGDSLTEGLGLYGYVKTSNVVAVRGLNLTTALKKMKKIKKKNPKYVFVMLGINDLSFNGSTLDGVEAKYRHLIETIHKKVPGAKIYVESLLPVTSNYEKQHKNLSNKRIVKFNERLVGVSQSYDYTTYVDIHQKYVNKKGKLPAKISADGYHLFSSAYETWVEYVKGDIE